MKLFFIQLLIVVPFLKGAAQNIINVQHQRGDIVKKKVVITNYNAKVQDNILLVNKYIDTKKQIIFQCGKTIRLATISFKQLKEGYTYYPLGFNGALTIHGGENIIDMKIVNGRLKISCDVYGFDQKYIAKIVNNRLFPSKSDYHLYVSDKYFELFDEYYIPVLQVELQKETNSIYIAGAFNRKDGYTIISQKSLRSVDFTKPKLLMTQHERDSLLNDYLENTKDIKPIHE